MLADPDRQLIYRQAFRAYLHANAPRTQNGLLIINRELLDAAADAGHEALAKAQSVEDQQPTTGTAADGLVRG